MKRLIIWLAAFAVLAACEKTPVAQVSATFENAKDSAVVLQKLNYNRLLVVDTLKTDAAGRINRKLKLQGNDPYFYYFYLGDKPVASLILRPSDQVTLHVPASGPFTVEGSEESTLLQQVNSDFAATAAEIAALTRCLIRPIVAFTRKRLGKIPGRFVEEENLIYFLFLFVYLQPFLP